MGGECIYSAKIKDTHSWATPHTDKYFTQCSQCGTSVNIKSGLKINLDRHQSTTTHKRAVEHNKTIKKKGGTLRTFMGPKNANPSDEKIMRAEAVHVIKLVINNENIENV